MSVTVAYRPVVADEQGDWGQLALQWIEEDQCANLIIDDELQVHWANSRTSSLAEECPHLSIRMGRLWLGKMHTEFRGLLSHACEDLPRFSTFVESGEEWRSLMVSVRRLSTHRGKRLFGVKARHWNDLDSSGIRQTFGLTDSEMRVVTLLFVRGMTAEQAASASDLSIETIRTHIRRLYTKLNVCSREAMFVRLRPFLVNLRT